MYNQASNNIQYVKTLKNIKNRKLMHILVNLIKHH